MLKRNVNIITTPQPHQGFLGAGHTARSVIADDFRLSDPFIMLMDDQISVPAGDPVGGPHPHAGFETVTLALEGKAQEPGIPLNAGDFEMMTAGSGIVHAELLPPLTQWRILQLWLTLPKKNRWVAPRVQSIKLENVPQRSENGVNIRVYSGTFAGMTSPVKNHVPVIIADITMEANTTTVQQLPASYNTFLYVIDGNVEAGENEKLLSSGQTGWLDLHAEDMISEIRFTSGPAGARFVLYGGLPQRDDIIAYGPFIADSKEDIQRLYSEFRRGEMRHVNTLPEAQVFNY